MTTSSGSRRTRRKPNRTPQTRRPPTAQRRVGRAREMVDFARDYEYVRHELKRISLWSVLLFALMFAGYFYLAFAA